MLKANLLALLILLFETGCAKKPLQPGPSTFTLWKKAGASVEEVKNSMNKCNFIDPYTSYGMTENSYAKAQICMVDRGFVTTAEGGIFCDQDEYRNRLSTCLERQKKLTAP
jgi:hypothetical protein